MDYYSVCFRLPFGILQNTRGITQKHADSLKIVWELFLKISPGSTQPRIDIIFLIDLVIVQADNFFFSKHNNLGSQVFGNFRVSQWSPTKFDCLSSSLSSFSSCNFMLPNKLNTVSKTFKIWGTIKTTKKRKAIVMCPNQRSVDRKCCTLVIHLPQPGGSLPLTRRLIFLNR